MPLYVCNHVAGALDEPTRALIAEDIKRIHCEVTAAPPTFVHAFFFEEAPHLPLDGKKIFVFGSIRGGRDDGQKTRITREISRALHERTGIALESIAAVTADTPASWVMEGGDILPEPGEEEAWLQSHEAKLASARDDT